MQENYNTRLVIIIIIIIIIIIVVVVVFLLVFLPSHEKLTQGCGQKTCKSSFDRPSFRRIHDTTEAAADLQLVYLGQDREYCHSVRTIFPATQCGKKPSILWQSAITYGAKE